MTVWLRSRAGLSLYGVMLCCSAIDSQWGFELSPVAAILGGIMGQELVKAISKKDEPIFNFFVFNGEDCQGLIVTMPLPGM